MKLKQALDEARASLEASKIEESSLEAEILLRHTLGIDRTQLFLNLGRTLDEEELARFRAFIKRRIAGEPSAYITGHREFFGLDFIIDRSVLIPRPETELLVEKAIEWGRQRAALNIADVGTGSGIIAVCLALNLPSARIYASDISGEALEVARRNCIKHSVVDKVTLLQGDLLTPLPVPADLVVANLPYVKREECDRLPDPLMALNGGTDGLDQIRRLCRQTRDKLAPGGGMLLEIGLGQDKAVIDLLHKQYPRAQIQVYKDLAGIPRVVGLQKG